MHIGLIGGIGPAATEFYYRGLVNRFSAQNRRLELTIVHADTREMIQNLEAGNATKQAEIFNILTSRLKAAGADFVVVTSLGGHFCIKEFEVLSSLPLLNAIPVLEDYFAKLGVNKIGLLGSGLVMRSKLYGGVKSVEVIAPKGKALDAVHKNYMEIALSGRAKKEHIDFFKKAGQSLCENQGADVVVLAGTDLFVAFENMKPDFPVVDAAEIHIEAIVKKALSS